MFTRPSLVILALCLTGIPTPSWARLEDGRTKVGPAGRNGGKPFADKPLPAGARVVGVKIRHGRYIDGLELLYQAVDGKKEGLGWHGGNGGAEETFLLDDGECITGITGTLGEYYVESLRIVTNERKSMVFGRDGGAATFELHEPGEEVVGFFGRSGAYLDQLGILVHKGPDRAGQPGKAARIPAKEPPRHAIDHLAIDLGFNVKMEFVRIKAGEFLMGSPDSDKDADAFEKPQRRVNISKDYYLGKYPVTQEQYSTVMKSNPSRFRFGGGGIGPGIDTRHFPVENVTWQGAADFCAELTRRDNHGRVFSLPTEAEWEYAARAGTRTRYSFGDESTDLRRFAWYRENSGRTPHIVGTMRPNAWGLYDMHGNVWQWCVDGFGQYYDRAGREDPRGPDGGTVHVIRGGSWRDGPLACRSADRHATVRNGRFEGERHLQGIPPYRDQTIGFRVAVRPGIPNGRPPSRLGPSPEK
jgi:formylglycine-generating enzyme required for sulfatase activity